MNKAVLIVLDSAAIGEAPDAADFGDAGSATIPHLAEAAGGLNAPVLESMGLGNIPALIPKGLPIAGVNPVETPTASYGAMEPVSIGKDTITGHWEFAGLEINPGFTNFPLDFPSFPDDLLREFEKQTGRGTIGNKSASGTVIIAELGEEHMKTGSYIVYTSADSVFQIAAHNDIVSVKELYEACEIARKLCDPLRVGRIIARPFIGEPGNFTRTEDRKDYAYEPDEPTILERLTDAGIPVYAVGKIEDIYAHRGMTESVHTANNLTSQKQVEVFTKEKEGGLIFANFIDFDMLYGHRRDPKGYAECIEQTDQWLKEYIPMLDEGDMLIITADHGNDPTFAGTDHTREFVPLLVYQPGKEGQSLGIRKGFFDIAQTLAEFFGIDSIPRGKSWL